MYGAFTYMYPVNYRSHPAQGIVGCTLTKVTSMGKWVFMGCGPPQESLENTRINTMGTLSQGYTQVSLEKRFRGW